MPERPLTLDAPNLMLELDADVVWETIAAERRRIAAELHDTVGQALYGLTLALEAARSATYDPQLSEIVERARALAREAATGVRRAIFALPLPELRAAGLGPSVRALVQAFEKETAIPATLDLQPLPAVEPAAAEALFRCAREALVNVARHARAGTMRVSLRRSKGFLSLEVSDDGVGLAAADWRSAAGYGLRSLAAQISRAGGSFDVRRGRECGTILRAQLPVRRK